MHRPGLALVLLAVGCGEDKIFASLPPPLEVPCPGSEPTSAWVPQPVPAKHGLGAIWGPGDGTLWAVGEQSTVLRYQNGAWSDVSPMITGADLFGVHGSGPDDVWAVGRKGVVLRFDGMTWFSVPSGTDQDWASVWVPERGAAWVAGADGVRRWDGTAFTRPAGAPAGAIHGLWASSATDLWMAGDARVSHFDGAHFADQSFGGAQILYALWGGAGRIWVIGRGTSNQPGLAELIDQKWNFGAAPSRAVFFSAWSLDPNRVYVGAAGSSIFRRDAGAWCRDLGGGTGAINGFFGASPTDVWAAGAKRGPNNESLPLLFRRQGS